jgi:sulfofructose kinase
MRSVLAERAPRRKGPVIVCAGISVHDIVMRVKSFPAPGNKVPASDFIITGGGCAGNAAVTAARLGARVKFAGPLGDAKDEISNRIITDLEAEGIDCSGAVRVAGGSASVSLILLDALGEKSIATRRGARLSSAVPADAATLVATADAILIDNRFPEFVTPIARAAARRRIPIVIDLDQATKVKDPLLALGTHLIASTEAMRGTTRLEDHATALQMLGFDIQAVDTLGAGDAFHGAFTVALAEGRDTADCLRFASAAAAIKCTRFGGTSGAPKRGEVEALIR